MAETLVLSYETGGNNYGTIGDNGGNEQDQAQSFTLNSTALITRIDIFCLKVNTISSAITMRVETNGASVPSGTLANANATGTFTPTNTSYDWNSLTFSTPFSLTGGTKYWIKCTVPDQSNDNRYQWRMVAPGGYAGHGDSTSVNGGAWSSEGTYDYYFRIYADVATSSGSESMLLSF